MEMKFTNTRTNDPKTDAGSPQATPIPMTATGGTRAAAIITPTSAEETPEDSESAPATPAASATTNDGTPGESRSRTSPMANTSFAPIGTMLPNRNTLANATALPTASSAPTAWSLIP